MIGLPIIPLPVGSSLWDQLPHLLNKRVELGYCQSSFLLTFCGSLHDLSSPCHLLVQVCLSTSSSPRIEKDLGRSCSQAPSEKRGNLLSLHLWCFCLHLLKLASSESELIITSVTPLVARIDSTDLTDGQRIPSSLLSHVPSSYSWERSHKGQPGPFFGQGQTPSWLSLYWHSVMFLE